jgi:hypothetical protein
MRQSRAKFDDLIDRFGHRDRDLFTPASHRFDDNGFRTDFFITDNKGQFGTTSVCPFHAGLYATTATMDLQIQGRQRIAQ